MSPTTPTSTDDKPKPSGESRPGPGHEKNDVSIRGIVLFVVWLVGVGIGVQILMWGVFRLFAHETKSLDRPVPAMVEKSLRRLPPAPRLEDRPLAPRTLLNARENARLSSYGWVEKSKGLVHIPIDRAMDLIAERGIAETKGAPGGIPPASPTPPASPSGPGGRP
jgi:hypothetical protein